MDTDIINYRKIFSARKNRFTSFTTEKEAQQSLCNMLGGRMEVKCKYGRIDLITNELLVEVKKYSSHNAKMALGQVLVYATLYDHLKPTLAFLGSENQLYNEVGEKFGINIWWVQDGIWSVGYSIE